jgi:protein SCO1/2
MRYRLAKCIAAASVLAATSTLLLFQLGCGTRQFHGLTIETPTQAPPLRFSDAGGTTFDLDNERGRSVLISFGYSCCPDMCPRTLSTWAQARRLLGPNAERVRFVFVSVDPGRDSPARIQEFVRRFDSSFVGVSGSAKQLDPILHAWRQPARQAVGAAAGDYPVAHSGQAYLVDPRGRVRVVYPLGVSAQDLASDLAAIR